jgi:hypothetical protein
MDRLKIQDSEEYMVSLIVITSYTDLTSANVATKFLTLSEEFLDALPFA